TRLTYAPVTTSPSRMMTASAPAWGLSPSHAVALPSGTGGIPSPPGFIHFALRSIGGVSGLARLLPSGYPLQNIQFIPKNNLSTLEAKPPQIHRYKPRTLLRQ